MSEPKTTSGSTIMGTSVDSSPSSTKPKAKLPSVIIATCAESAVEALSLK